MGVVVLSDPCLLCCRCRPTEEIWWWQLFIYSSWQ